MKQRIFQTVSAKKKNILEQNRALREITRVQSHEVRHPVVNMMSLVNLLSIPEEKELHSQYLLLLKKELENLDQKIKNIVDIAS